MPDFIESTESGLFTKPAFRLTREASAHPLILVCEHASRYIPPALDNLGLNADIASSHIAWDIGALALAESLAEALGATLLSATYSRLLIDLNRPLSVADSIPTRSEVHAVPGNQCLDDATREHRRQSLYQPFHQRLKGLIDQRLAQGRTVRLVGIHSFTPVYFGQPRSLDIGVLFGQADAYAGRIIAGLRRPGLSVAANQPYKVTAIDDVTVPVHGDGRALDSALIEVRNDLLRYPEQIGHWTDLLAPLL